ncbi:hypothetical protein A9Q84_08680 [Halobacteriovorax marinus]|uniref:Uncharacterized protein n=1 Tax=Halobacteriovorax marinus TaxID=97084 RepID=A0A1Y5F6A5_9BACT|nr:hypothetical protein A9Q84_08680 [Halobacteriovorax marinus]
MAISLNDINNKSKKGVKSILDVILERKEEKLSGKAIKKKVLRPWQRTSESHVNFEEQSSKKKIMNPFEKRQTKLSEDEIMAIKITERAKELFINIQDFL